MSQDAMTIQGRVLTVGDNISTDHILPSRHMTQVKPEELAAHCLAGVSPDFSARVRVGDILAAGWNIGYGSSREQAPRALWHAGFRAVVARSFARIFFRNCYNIGLPAIACPVFIDSVREGDQVRIDLGRGVVENSTQNVSFPIPPLPDFLLDYIRQGGLIPYLSKRLG